MKKGIFSIALAALIVIAALFYFAPEPAQAGDTYNQSVQWFEGETFILYYGTIAFSTDSTGNFYTRAMDVGEANDAVGSIRADASDVTGTEDINIAIEYSNAPTAEYTTSSIDILDQVTTTAKVDSLGDDPQFFQHRWVRLKADGQAGNPAATTLSWWLFVKKRAGAPAKCAGARATS